MARLGDLPTELLWELDKHLVSYHDISSLSQVNRRFYHVFFWRFLDAWFREIMSSDRNSGRARWYPRPKFYVLKLFYHAAKNDSVNITQCIISETSFWNLAGVAVPAWESRFKGPLHTEHTFLHLALLGDAPSIAELLIELGADIDQVSKNYPDLTTLCLTLARPETASQRNLDVALRIASSYAFPRTTRVLLEHGANPNIMNLGLSALHIAVARRLPWRTFRPVHTSIHLGFFIMEDPYQAWSPEITQYLNPEVAEDLDSEVTAGWSSAITDTASRLLESGAQVDLPTDTARSHQCTNACWQSLDCDHRGQIALHLACGGGIMDLVCLLLDYGADPSATNSEGYTPLYYALVQGHGDVAKKLLDILEAKDLNPIVSHFQLSTALHVACRYAFSDIVEYILERGADPDVVDKNGKTPLHEVLGQTRAIHERDIFRTLECLDRFGANPDVTTYQQSPSAMAKIHPFQGVRDMFRPSLGEKVVAVSADCYSRQKRINPSSRRGRQKLPEDERPRSLTSECNPVPGPSIVSPNIDDEHVFPALVATNPSPQLSRSGAWSTERTRSMIMGLPLNAKEPNTTLAADSATAVNVPGSELFTDSAIRTDGPALAVEPSDNKKAGDTKKAGTGKRGKKWKPLQL
ncbi:hypothetical protein V8F20_011284 [Naviculisporaceae sp. PSN 640]